MKIRRLICATATIGITTVNANCNPLTETCAPIPGITSTFHTDFTKLATADVPENGWTIANYATFRTDSTNGGIFPIEKRFDAPYIWTTPYFHYGHVDVTMQAAPGAGVISSAVLMSDTADEVDWEWSGNNYGQDYANVQTNYFGKGITGSYDRSTSVSPEFEMTTGFHKYGIDWTAESLTWTIDDQVVRTLYRKDCDDGEHQYPQTPSRFHLGVWVAGDPSKPAGVIQWAGGETDLNKLPYTAYVKDVNLEPASKCAYYNYTDKSGSSDSVKCLAELPKALSSVISSSALNTLSAAQPAPATASNTISTSGADSSSSSGVTGGTTSTIIASSSGTTQASGGSSSPSGTADGTTSTDTASSGSTQASQSSGSVQLTTSTVFKTTVFSTVTSCNTEVTNCPANKPLQTVLVTDVVVDYTTVCPVTEGTAAPSSTVEGQSTGSAPEPASSTAGGQASSSSAPVAQNSASQPTSSSTGPSSTSANGSSSTPKASSSSSSKRASKSKSKSNPYRKGSSSSSAPIQATSFIDPARRPGPQESSVPASFQASVSSDGVSGAVTGSESKQDSTPSGSSATGSTTQPPELTTSTVYSTNIYTVTSCGPDVTSCPAKSTVLSTEVVVAYTTVCPVSSDSIIPSSGSPEPSSDTPSTPRPSDGPALPSPSPSTIVPPKNGAQQQSSQTASPGTPSAPHPSDSAPPSSQSLSTIIPPKDGSQEQSSQTASPSSPSAPVPDNSAPAPSSSTINPPKDGSEKQTEKPASSSNPSALAPSSGAPPPSSSTIVSSGEAHEVPPSGSSIGSHDATTSMEYGQTSASLYNTDTELKASGSSTPPPALPTDKGGDIPQVAQNHAIPGADSSQVAAGHGSAPPPAEKGHTSEGQSPPGVTPGPDSSVPASAPGAGDSHSSTGLAHPVPASGSDVASTTRSTITRTTTVRLTKTKQSTSTIYSTSATVITSCGAGKSGVDCSTISSTTTLVISRLVTPVTFTTEDVHATTETVDVALTDGTLSSAAAQGASGVAGEGTGTGKQLAGAKTTTLAKVAGAGRAAFEAVPGVLVALAMGVFLL